jgi:hypothetical protein
LSRGEDETLPSFADGAFEAMMPVKKIDVATIEAAAVSWGSGVVDP